MTKEGRGLRDHFQNHGKMRMEETRERERRERDEDELTKATSRRDLPSTLQFVGL